MLALKGITQPNSQQTCRQPDKHDVLTDLDSLLKRVFHVHENTTLM